MMWFAFWVGAGAGFVLGMVIDVILSGRES